MQKEPKLYLWDWSEVTSDGPRFENMIASHLLKYCDYLTDTGVGKFELAYLKNKEGYEIDFVIIKNGKAFLPVEVKMSKEAPSDSWKKILSQTECKQGIQLVMTPNIYKIFEFPDYKILTLSAAHFLQMLV